MKPITRVGTIENGGGIGPGNYAPLDFSPSDAGGPLASSGPVGSASLISGADLASPVSVAAGSEVAGSAAAAGAFAPFVIDPIFGGSITRLIGTGADPTTAAEVEGAINAAIAQLETGFTSSVPAVINNGTISNSVTINIEFDYGTIAGRAMTAADAVSRSQSSALVFPFAQVNSLLPNLPAVDPTLGGLFYLPQGQMKLLGFSGGSSITATSSELDGDVGLNTIANGVTLDWNLANQTAVGEVGAVGALEHEITEVLGRVSILGTSKAGPLPMYTLLDLDRYSAPGVAALTPGASDYFSLNGGTTSLATYNNATNGGDPGDWAASVPNDAFDAFLVTGSPASLSNADVEELGAIGMQAVNSPLTIAGAAAGQSTNDQTPITVFPQVTITDGNVGQTETVTATLSAAANGKLTNLGGGSYNATTGVYTDTGSAAAVTSALDGLVFTPTAHQVAAGGTVTTGFTIHVANTVGSSASDATSSVVSTAAPATNPGLLAVFDINQQLGLIYIAYYDRAADDAGFAYWSGQNSQAQGAGASATTVLTGIANAFATQTETETLYPSLAPYLVSSPPSLNTPAGQAALTSFLDGIYTNLFNRSPDGPGANYWLGQFSAGLVTLGAAALAIANGATGNDAIQVSNKVTVGLDFTNRTKSNGLGVSVSTPLPTTFLPAAKAALNGVDGLSLNDASVTAGMNMTSAFLASVPSGFVTTSAEIATPITISASSSVIDPGAGSFTIQFLPGSAADTVVLHNGGTDQIAGFNPVAGDLLDLRSLIAEAGVNVQDVVANPDSYFTVATQGADATLMFDPLGHGGGSAVAVLRNLGGTVQNLSDLTSHNAVLT